MFLVFAWGVMPLGLRATVIAVVTAAVFGAATLAARKGLASSADAIAALGSLLVVLDAWALHATGLVPQPDGATFAAVAALGSGTALVGLGVVLRLDVPRAVGCVLLPLAPLLLSIDAPSPSLAALLVLVGVAVCGIERTRLCERRAAPVLRVLAVVLLVSALLVTLSAFFVDGALAAASVLLAVAAVSHTWASFLRPRPQVWPVAAGVTQTLAVVCAALALTGGSSVSSLWVAPLAALAGAGSVELLRRLVPALEPSTATAGWWTFFTITAAPVLMVATSVLAALATARPATPSGAAALWAGLAGLVVALVGSLLRPRRPVRAEPVPPGAPPAPPVAPFEPARWFAALVLVGAAALLPALPLVVAYWLIVPLTLVVAVGPRLPRAWRTTLRASCLTSVALAILMATVLSAGAAPTVADRDGRLLLAASFLTLMIVLLLARRWVTQSANAAAAGQPRPQGPRPDPVRRHRANLLLTALIVGATAVGTAAGTVAGELGAAWPGASLPLLVLSLGLLVLADRRGVDDGRVRVLSRRLSVEDLHAVLVATATVCAVTLLASASTPGGWLVDASGPDAPPAWVAVLAVTSATLLALAGGLLALDRRRLVASGAVEASAAATPALTVLAALSVRALTGDRVIEWEIVVLVVLAFFPIVAAVRVDAARVRTAMEAGSVVLAAVTLLSAAARRPMDVLTVALVVAASAAAAWAFMPGRARAGWGALGLGTVASWNALASGGIGTVEAYTAPAAVVLAVVGAWRARRGSVVGRAYLLAGTAILLLPTTLLAPASPPWRSLVVVAALVALASGVLVAGRRSAAAPASASASKPGLTTWFALLGLGAAVVGVGGRAVVLAAAWSTVHGTGSASSTAQARSLLSEPTALPALWIPLAALSVPGFASLLGRSWPWSAATGPRAWAAALTALVVTVPVWTLAAARSVGDAGTTGAVVSLVVLWGVVALLGTPPGLPRVASRTEFLHRAVPPLVAAYVVALGLMGSTSLHPDLVLTLVGVFVAVVAVRAAVLERLVSTWKTVAYGVLATLAPVTVALLGDPQGWRVALGVVGACGWLLAGLRLRWQAPVAIGAAALVLQVVVLAGPPALAALTGIPGWVVLAVTGLVLLLLGLTYERQLTSARATLRRYAELR